MAFPFSVILLDALLILAPLFFIAFIERKKLSAQALGFPAKQGWAEGAIISAKIFLALIVYSLLLAVIFSFVYPNGLESVKQVASTLAATSPILLIYFFVVRVFAEEFFFRAILVPRIGIVASGILFGLAHIGYGSAAEVIGAYALGIILGIAYKQYRSIVPNFIAHMLYNFVALGLMGIF